MALEKHMLLTHSLFEKAGEVFEGVAKLKERIAELESERDAFEKSFNEMTEAFMKSQRALWLARANRASVEAILNAIKWGLGDDTYIRWKNAEKALERKLKELK